MCSALQPPSPEQPVTQPDELDEEEEEPEQKTAYQKLLSTLSHPTSSDESEEDESTDEEEEELLEGELFILRAYANVSLSSPHCYASCCRRW